MRQLELTFTNEFGEKLTMFINEDLIPMFNHEDIHEDGKTEPLAYKYKYILSDDEKFIMNNYEFLANKYSTNRRLLAMT